MRLSVLFAMLLTGLFKEYNINSENLLTNYVWNAILTKLFRNMLQILRKELRVPPVICREVLINLQYN